MSFSSDVNILYSGTVGFYGGKLYKSTNGGSTWEQTGVLDNIEAIEPDHIMQGTVYVSQNGIRIYKTTNSGQSWFAKVNWELMGASGISALVVDHQNSNIVYAPVCSLGIMKSYNGGDYWFNADSGITNMIFWDLEMNPTNHLELFCITNGGAFSTNDGGYYWELYSEGLSDAVGQDLEYTLDGQTLYCATNKGIYKRDLITSISEDYESDMVTNYRLLQNYPNPFNPTTTISFSLPNKSYVKLNIYDLLGRQIKVLVEEYKSAGNHKAEFNAGSLPSGIYFYKLKADNYTETKKMVLLR